MDDAAMKPVGWVTTYTAFSMATPPSVGDPTSPASWPKMMFTATPVRNPSITERETNRM